MKVCKRCKKELPISAFHSSTRSKDGLQAYCAPCGNEARTARVTAKRESLLAALPEDHGSGKRCPQCREVLARSDYWRNRSNPDGLQAYCKSCSREIQRRYAGRHSKTKEVSLEEAELREAERLARKLSTEGFKLCPRCSETKPLVAFYPHGGTRDGRSGWCIECHKAASRARKAANREQAKEYNAAYRARPGVKEELSAKHRMWQLRRYGLTPEEYDKLLAEQGGVCAICGLPEYVIDRRKGKPRCLSVDHDHVTLKVRGLLCGRCNRTIGHFEDNPAVLARAAAYLQKAAEGK